MLGHLDRAGFKTTGSLEAADVAVVNTCAFLETAVQESIDTVLEVAKHKTHGRLQHLIVAGCLTERYREELLNELPEVDAVMRTSEVDRVVQVVRGLQIRGEPPRATASDPDLPGGDMSGRVLSTSVVSPYVKISEGCSAKCTFCIIPQLRGPGRSRSIENILEEAERLGDQGARELVLIAQDLTAYGTDLYGAPSLGKLLRALNNVQTIRWIRLMYANPFYWTDELISAVAECERVIPYADMPIQHITDNMLKRMGRQTNAAYVRSLIHKLRDRVPGIALRTNVILGFPGETDHDVQELLEFLDEARFDKLVAFPYSAEQGTAAVNLRDHVDPEVIEDRVTRILTQQGEISLSVNRSQIGSRLEVLIEEAGSPAVGRSTREAPEVDGCVRVAGTDLKVGEFYTVRITGADAYDLVGEVENQVVELEL